MTRPRRNHTNIYCPEHEFRVIGLSHIVADALDEHILDKHLGEKLAIREHRRRCNELVVLPKG